MPELPDITIYVEALSRRVAGRRLDRIRLASPFFLRTVDPPLRETEQTTVAGVSRLGKRIVFTLGGTGTDRPSGAGIEEGGHDDARGKSAGRTTAEAARAAGTLPAGSPADFFLVLHLMIAGRLRWKPAGAKLPGKLGLAAFDFETGTLLVTEAGSKKRASLHLVRGREALEAFHRGGLEPLEADLAAFRAALLGENHTLKRALTDPRLFSGIGNSYSDEILHAARLSPMALTSRLADEQIAALHQAARSSLADWTERLRRETGDSFPEKVTAFRDGMAVHGRFGKPCPACGTAVQRIVYAQNECNYCPRCQTGGKLLADRALSRLLHDDWPRTIEELETGKS